jgi:hypothetical protein
VEVAQRELPKVEANLAELKQSTKVRVRSVGLLDVPDAFSHRPTHPSPPRRLRMCRCAGNRRGGQNWPVVAEEAGRPGGQGTTRVPRCTCSLVHTTVTCIPLSLPPPLRQALNVDTSDPKVAADVTLLHLENVSLH